MKYRWLLLLIPLSVSIGAALLFASGLIPNPILRARVDIGTLALLVGLGLTVLLGVILALNAWWHRALAQARAQTLGDALADRRRFLRRLDHELKNPLTAIRAGLANLTDSPVTGESVSSIEAQVRRLSRLTADLRKLAELETRALETATVDLAEVLTQVVELAHDRPETADRKLTLTLPQAPWPLPNMLGDRDLLLLVFHNLLDNALKFTRPGDTIEVRAAEDGNTLLLEIADTGPGIPPEDLPHVWEELYRGAGARGVPGSGLGLALVQAIVQRHNGHISLRSRAGQGTVFTLRFPAHSGG